MAVFVVGKGVSCQLEQGVDLGIEVAIGMNVLHVSDSSRILLPTNAILVGG